MYLISMTLQNFIAWVYFILILAELMYVLYFIKRNSGDSTDFVGGSDTQTVDMAGGPLRKQSQ